ncbi:MAG: type I DNA topoisomerase [Deltaproteobacteria bacterium]|nr:type I DNA topoisomerase [Deltaproteobacteria bacterium]
MKGLIVVESPAKEKTIKKILGGEYEVAATVGHIKDLPVNKIGVDVKKGFDPKLVTIKGKNKVIDRLKSLASKADTVFLAPDPDREGEAIAFHAADIVRAADKDDSKEIYRVLFQEITEKGIREGMKNPLSLNRAMYESQLARRILDRLVGYEISPLLWKKVKRGLSAGRVQSVAVRLIVDREREINAFVPKEFWVISARLGAANPPEFTAKLLKTGGEKAEVPDRETAEKLAESLEKAEFIVDSVEKKEKRRSPSPPFITSTLQQEANRIYRFPAKRTMQIAQKLYEGIELGDKGLTGLITYLRTDSIRLSDESVAAAREYISANFGEAYLPSKAVYYRNKKTAQDAHEAIRPTSVGFTPERVRSFLSPEELKIYQMIFNRFVACQMNPAVYDVTTVDIKAGDCVFRAAGSVEKFAGYLAVYRDNGREEGEGEEEGLSIPPLAEGERLNLLELLKEQKFTQPPPRHTESSLIKELEEKGIGRPSTYASIVSTIQEKEYVKKIEGRFKPTELGLIVTDLLVESFSDIVDPEFTARMEEELDEIEEEKKDRLTVLNDFYGSFSASLEKAHEKMKDMKREEIKTDVVCEKCGSPMVMRVGKKGVFLGCSAYPECRNIKEYSRDDNGKLVVAEEIRYDEKCPQCGGQIVLKSGRFGKFLACEKYPACRFTKPYVLDFACPAPGCSGKLTEKKTKTGKTFYSCSEYPKCRFASWNRPVKNPCPSCGFETRFERGFRGRKSVVCERETCAEGAKYKSQRAKFKGKKADAQSK